MPFKKWQNPRTQEGTTANTEVPTVNPKMNIDTEKLIDAFSKQTEQLRVLQERLDKLDNPKGGITTKRELYDGPRAYAIKIFRMKKVCDIRTVEMKDQKRYGNIEYIHDVEITYSDGSSEIVSLIDDFARNYTCTNTIIPDSIIDKKERVMNFSTGQWMEKNVKYFTFTVDGETFTVSERAINN